MRLPDASTETAETEPELRLAIERAVENEDYTLAAEIKAQLDRLRDGKPE